jgi:ferric enterobactin receptor
MVIKTYLWPFSLSNLIIPMNKVFFTLIIFLSSIVVVFGQTGPSGSTPDPFKGIIRGVVIDQETGEPLSYATVSLYSRGSSEVMDGTITDENGKFVFECKSGEYRVLVEFISYQPWEKSGILVNKGNPIIEVGEIQLGLSSAMLEAVEVVEEKATVQLALDKKVFNVQKDLANRGGSATDVLDNLPSVTVDLEGNVSLRGSQSVRILIDGKPSGLAGISSRDALQNLPANLIEKVEVVTNPSARYEAEGMAGIINIVMKKEKHKGLNGSLDLTASTPAEHGISFNQNFRRQKWNFFSNLGVRYRKFPGGGFISQELFDNETIPFLEQDRDRERGGWSYSFRGGADYSLSPKSTLTLELTGQYSDQENFTKTVSEDFNPERQLVNFSDRRDTEIEEEIQGQGAITWRRTYDREGRELTAFIDYQYSTETEDSDIIDENISYNSASPFSFLERQRSFNEEIQNNLITQLDYVHPFGENAKLEMGYRGGFRKIQNDFSVEDFAEPEQDWTPIGDLTNLLIYRENIYAAYAQAGSKTGSISYQLGLRAEYSDIETELQKTNEINPREYLSLFPSAFLGYEWGQNQTLQLSYSRRVRRPRFRELNPLFNFSNDRSLYAGNPNLDPEFTHSTEISYLKFWGKTSLTSAAYFRHTDGVISRIRRFVNDTLSISRPENLDTRQDLGLEFTFSSELGKWLRFNGNFNYFYFQTESGEDPSLNTDGFTWTSQLMTRFIITKTLEAQLRGRYRAPRNSPQGRYKALFSSDFTVSKELLNGKALVSFSVQDIFNSRRWRWINDTDEFFQEGSFQWRQRLFRMNINYRFNQDRKQDQRGGGRNGGGGYDMGF